jgi:hypothetical protein
MSGTPRRILLNHGPANYIDGFPALAFAEPGISTDSRILLIGTGTSNPSKVQTTHSNEVVDYSDTPGVIQKIYQAKEDSPISAPAYQVNTNSASPSGICEPGGDGDVGIVVKGVLIGRFTPQGFQLAGTLTYTGSGGVIMSFGTTAQRPGTPLHGFIWHNTTLDALEWWDGDEWRSVGGGGGGPGAWTHINHTNNNYAAQAAERLICNTDTAAFTVVLPAAPADKSQIEFIGDFAVRNLTINRNGKLIARVGDNLILNTDNNRTILVFDANINSWRVMQ